LPEQWEGDISKLQNAGKTTILVAADGYLKAVLGVADKLKDQTRVAIRYLKDLGLKLVMLTGDNRQTADVIAHEAGIDEVIAEVLPDEKSSKIKELQDRG
jgi:Cu+-exporting ATPase